MNEMLEEMQDDDLEYEDHRDIVEAVSLATHQRINGEINGEIIVMEKGYVEVRLTTTPDMIADDEGLIHGGFIFSSADYAAMAAVNEKNVVLVACDCQFLSPVKFRDEVRLIARVRHKEGKKRNVHVEGYVLDIKVFEGEFKTVVTERHVLKLRLLEGMESEQTGESEVF